ncbi:tetratricopeptide repeat protein [Rhizobium leguminosarum]|uniref:tetratricopeptide repeat protein n=1 Tax=Rhizobium leguminosarum TaxID=384 RepID=UPI001C9441D8|nr:adenylate/guanylate cyclase domain-containing protein [Rhizobium leguminosarum]MBY5336434.1 tetratricopeptide repeat protein [Rhizobium leguminosarum]
MDIYFAAVFTDLVRHSAAWNRVSRDSVTTTIAEYRYLSQTLASQYGRRHENFTGDGHLYLFESADVAVHFSLKLIAYWKQRRRHLMSDPAHDLPIRVGCHFGECSRMYDDDAWIGRALNIAKRVESCAEPDTLLVTQTVLDLIDLPVYLFQEVDVFELKGDYLPRRHLYRVLSVDQRALAARSEEQMTAEDWFLKGAGIVGTDDRQLAEEMHCCEKALELRIDYPEAHNNLGVILKRSGDRITAEKHYRDAIRLWPQYPEAHYNLAILLEETDRPEEAETHYRQALKCRPEYVDALLRLAGLFDAWGDRHEAEHHFRESLRLRPGFAEAHNNFGVFLESQGEVKEAESHYIQAVRARPNYAEAHYNYAMLLEVRDLEEAEKHYRAAIRAVPEYAEAHNNLAVLLHEKGSFSDARSHYLTAIRIRPADAQTYQNLSLLLAAMGEDEQAARYARRAAEIIDG